MKNNISWYLLISISILILLTSCSMGNQLSSETTLNQELSTASSTAVTLFAPQGLTTTYLIDEEALLINTWESSYRPGLSVYLLEDHSLLRTAALGNNPTFGITGGAGGRVERFDWDGKQLWEFEFSNKNYLLHHDIEYLPNGNILMIAWEYKSAEEAIAAGRDPLLLSEGELWPDMIIEVEPTGSSGGRIIWEWHVWDHLIQDYDASKANYDVVSDNPDKININMVLMRGGADWTHCNAVDYNVELRQILLTVHNFSEIWIIDHNTTTAEAKGPAGDLLYRWGNPRAYNRGSIIDQQLFVPHDGRWIESDCPGANDILIFNNGSHRPNGNYSSVDQITPPLNGAGRYDLYKGEAFEPLAPNWVYKSDPLSEFYADHISGSQRLPNGNTLICDGTSGVFFEVTTKGEKVWEYINPYSSSTPVSNNVFRAVRYYLEMD